MKIIAHILIGLFTASLLVFSGCSSGGGDSSSGETTTSLSGVAQKGAFVKDSNVSLCKLDEKMLCTSDKLEAKVSDDKGSYEFKTLPWNGLSRLTISGYYLDELTGSTSLSPATITAIVDIKSNVKQNSNTNILTDMQAKRMRDLVDKGKSIDEALDESKDDVKKLFNVSSDDFTELDLLDFSAGQASVNVELLRISAAVANAEDPVGTLEELMKIYNEYGIEAVLSSTLYKTLMGLIENVDVKEVLSQMTSAEEADAVTVTAIAPFAIANIVTFGVIDGDSKVRITLIGTEFIGSPSISVSSQNQLSIDSIQLSDDNKSAILDMNQSTSCMDINATFTVDYMTLKDVENPIRTTTLRYKDANTICTTSNTNDDINTTPITVDPTARISLVPFENTKIKLTLMGTEFENYTALNAELITSSSSLAIVSTEVADNNKSVIFTLNEATNYCAEDNVTIGLYTPNLKGVANTSDTFKSNKIRYVSPNSITSCGGGSETTPIPFNRAPTVSITPNSIIFIDVGTILELNATAQDVNSEDTISLQWRYKVKTSTSFTLDAITSQFTHKFDTMGHYIVEVNATDNHGASTQESIEFEVVAINHAPTIRISPSGDKNIALGDTLVLKSNAEDVDGDILTVSWKLKEQGESSFTPIALYGATGFSYTFNTLGSYLVVVEVEDSNGSKVDANITVTVEATPTVEITLADINMSVVVKGQTNAITTNGSSDILDEAYENPQHGEVSYFKIGNEVPAFTYTSTDCFLGMDTFIYQNGDSYGRVNITITAPSSLETAADINMEIFNTEVIEGNYLRANSASVGIDITTPTHGGSSSLTIVGNEIVNYNYDPDDTFVGDDYFIYTLTETIDSCNYSSDARVNFDVSTYVSERKVISTCRDPYTIGTELYSTDGTLEETRLLKDLTPGIYSTGKAATTGFMSMYSELFVNGIQYFVAYHSAGETKAFELYETDATPEGTFVHDINTHNVFTSQYLYGSSHPGGFNKIDNAIYFTASDSTYDRYGMYRADGVSVTRIADNVIGKPVKMNNSYYYLSSIDNNVSLYKLSSDFTSSVLMSSFEKEVSGRTTTILSSVNNTIIYTEYISSSSSYALYSKTETGDPIKLTDLELGYFTYEKIGDKLYMIAGEHNNNTVANILETDGTVDGTKIVGTFTGQISAMTAYNNKIYFKGTLLEADWMRDINLYELDVDTTNISFIADIAYGYIDDVSVHLGMGEINVIDNKLVYESVNVEDVDGVKTQYELLWASNGTAYGTVITLKRERSCVSNSCQAADLQGMFTINGEYYFQDVVGRLYKTDFSENGTEVIIDSICDITPYYLEFDNIVDADRGVVYEANLTIEGISYPQTKLSIENGEYSLDNGSSWSTQDTTVSNGQKVRVRQTSSSEYDTSVETKLYVGLRNGVFSTKTLTETLATPNQFTFTDTLNVAVDTVQNANITVTGINVEVPLHIVGGEYSIDAGSSWYTTDTNVTNNQVVYVRHTSSTSNEITVDTILTVGGISDTFSSTTREAAVGTVTTVVVDALMWEDTEHVVGIANSVTWVEGESYCADLVLEDYSDWRLPHSSGENNEVISIRVETDDDTAGNAIVEGFSPVYHEQRVATWTDEVVNENSHVAMIFQYDVGNGDGFANTQEEVNVRCVRDIEQ